MSNLGFKKKFIESLYQRDGPEPHIRGNSYVVRCPYCGDSPDIRKAHFYITIHMDDETPILYNCFRCPVGGVVNKEVMARLGLMDEYLTSGITILNKSVVAYDKKEINQETKILVFDYELPEIKDGKKLDYIRNRLGVPFTMEDFYEMKVITSLRDFYKKNDIKKLTCSDKMAYFYEENFVGFLSHGNGYILLRDITGKADIPWIKYPVIEKAREGKVFYSLASQIDIFTEDTITVNLAEGVFDILGVYHHLHKKEKNTINIAVTGKYYETAMYYLIGLGIAGSNVRINIYADNDASFNKKGKTTNDTSIEYYQNLFKDLKYLFKVVYVYYNEISKDMGVPKEKIMLKKYKL